MLNEVLLLCLNMPPSVFLHVSGTGNGTGSGRFEEVSVPQPAVQQQPERAAIQPAERCQKVPVAAASPAVAAPKRALVLLTRGAGQAAQTTVEMPETNTSHTVTESDFFAVGVGMVGTYVDLMIEMIYCPATKKHKSNDSSFIIPLHKSLFGEPRNLFMLL